MTDDEIDKDWSQTVAALVVDSLLQAGIVSPVNNNKAVAIVAEEIVVRLALGDRPDRSALSQYGKR